MRQVVDDKPIYQSKTFWVNLIAIAIAVLTFLLDHELVKDNVQFVQIFGVIIGLLNVVLRWFTSQPVTIS